MSRKVIVCDLGGTLAPSRSPISKDMAEVLCHILSKHSLVIVSGEIFSQFQDKVLSQLPCGGELLKNLSLFPTMGSSSYVYDSQNNTWKKLYDEKMTLPERQKIIAALNEVMKLSGIDFSEHYGDLIEDRESQVTFSGMGHSAPIEIKEKWDKDLSKRQRMIAMLNKKIPDFEIRVGGSTSIDINRKGIDKAYAIKKIKELLKAGDDDIVYIGDSLYKGGSDEVVTSTGVDFIQESNPNETLEILSRYM